MENAAKALLIAGGILIALLILTVLVYAITARNRIEQAEYEKKRVEEIAKFNSEFEAYNKNRLYGIDVITVINKAIAHNSRMQASSEDDKYFINVEFITKEDFKSEIKVIDNTSESKDENPISSADMNDLITASGLTQQKINDLQTAVINKDKKYLLGKETTENDVQIFITNLNFKKNFENNMTDITVTNSSGTKTYKIYSALTNFKKAIFACTNSDNDPDKPGKLLDEKSSGVTYDNGIIKELRFVQIKTK